MLNLEYLSDLNILCINNPDAIGAFGINFLILGPVEQLISPVSLDVIIGLLDHSND